MKLNLKTNLGLFRVLIPTKDIIQDSVTLYDLKAVISNQINVKRSELNFFRVLDGRFWYLNSRDDQIRLKDLNIESGDTLFLNNLLEVVQMKTTSSKSTKSSLVHTYSFVMPCAPYMPLEDPTTFNNPTRVSIKNLYTYLSNWMPGNSHNAVTVNSSACTYMLKYVKDLSDYKRKFRTNPSYKLRTAYEPQFVLVPRLDLCNFVGNRYYSPRLPNAVSIDNTGESTVATLSGVQLRYDPEYNQSFSKASASIRSAANSNKSIPHAVSKPSPIQTCRLRPLNPNDCAPVNAPTSDDAGLDLNETYYVRASTFGIPHIRPLLCPDDYTYGSSKRTSLTYESDSDNSDNSDKNDYHRKCHSIKKIRSKHHLGSNFSSARCLMELFGNALQCEMKKRQGITAVK